jgi:hypothetical protein
MVDRLGEPQNIIESLSEGLDHFDDEEPMCSEARELFRNEIVPRAKRLLQGLEGKGDLDAARALVELCESFCGFVMLNGPASGVSDRRLLQRADLDEDGQRWQP